MVLIVMFCYGFAIREKKGAPGRYARTEERDQANFSRWVNR